MKTDNDFHDPGITPAGETLPTPLSRDHTYFSIPVGYTYSTAALHRNPDRSAADITTCRKEKSYTDVITDWNTTRSVRTQGNPNSDGAADRNLRSDVISASKPSTDSDLSSMTYNDAIDAGNTPCDVIGKPLLDVIEMGKPSSEMGASQPVTTTNIVDVSGQQQSGCGDNFDIFTDPKDAASSYGMLIDEEVIESFLSQAKAVKETPLRPDSRMKLDSRYRTNSSDSAFSEDSLLDYDQDGKLETLISQFIFNPTNDFSEYVESTTDATADHVDVDGLDVTDLFNSAAMFGSELGDPTSPGFAAAERESGMGSSENSICSDNHDAPSPAKRHKTSLLQKNDSISSLSSSSSCSSSSSPVSSTASSPSSAHLSLSSLSLEALSSSIAKSSMSGQRHDGQHSMTSAPPTDEIDEVWEQVGVCDDGSSVVVSLQARDGENCSLLSPAGEDAHSFHSAKSGLTRGDNSIDQGEDSTGFITLPTAHRATTKSTTTINNTTSNSSNSINNTNTNTTNIDDYNKDNYDFIFTQLKNGYQQPFEIREDNSDLLLDEPDFVDFPFPTEPHSFRPNQHNSPKKGMESNGTLKPIGSLAGFPSDGSNAKEKPAFLLEVPGGGEKVLDDNFTTGAMYLAKHLSSETPKLTPNNADYFNDYFEVDSERDEVEKSYCETVASQSPFFDWFSIDDNQIDNSLNGTALTSGLNFSEIDKPLETEHGRSDDSDIVEISPNVTSTPKCSVMNISPNTTGTRCQASNSSETQKSVRLLCSVKKCASSKRPVQTINLVKKSPTKKKSFSQCKTLPVLDKKTLNVKCHKPKTIACVNRAPQLNRTKCNQTKTTHSTPQIEILSWDYSGSIHVKVPKLSGNENESRNSQSLVPSSFLREALTAEEPHPRFLDHLKQGKHKNIKSKQYRNESPGPQNETSTGVKPASMNENSGSGMSELEKYLRGIIPTDPVSEGRDRAGENELYEDSSDVSFLRKLLTGEMSTHAYREIDRRICEKKRREIK